MTFSPVESITVGLYALALSIITVFVVAGSVPGGLGTIRGSTLGLGIRALNSVEFGTAKGAANGGKRLCRLAEKSQNEALQQVLDYTSL